MQPTSTLPFADDPWRPPAPAGPSQPRQPGRARWVAAVLAAGLLGGAAGGGLAVALDDDPVPRAATSLDSRPASTGGAAAAGSVEQVAATVLPSVVSIEVSGPVGGGEGTGVVMSEDGLILTNNHVVAAAASGGSVRVTFNDGSTAVARIVGRDPVTDLAVLDADATGLTPATFGSSADLAPGEEVVAIGSPLGLQGTVTSGIVSALDRPVRTGGSGPLETESTVIDAIQTDAAINPGNSGGPLVDLAGHVVGINSAIATLGGGGQSGSIGLGFSIPIDQARRVARQLVEDGQATHARLGVSVQDTADGAGIAAVDGTGAAAEAGLRPGDVVVSLDGRRIDGADALIAATRSHQPGERVAVTYLRDGARSTVTVALGSDG